MDEKFILNMDFRKKEGRPGEGDFEIDIKASDRFIEVCLRIILDNLAEKRPALVKAAVMKWLVGSKRS